MSRNSPLKEDLELRQLQQQDQELLRRQQECAAIPKKLAQELKERECTMPPLAEIADRTRLREHDLIVSRGEVANILRDQTRSVLLIILLLTATGSLVWWGIKLMHA
jgi:hypothetical protein